MRTVVSIATCTSILAMTLAAPAQALFRAAPHHNSSGIMHHRKLPVYKASGTHACWSTPVIGYTCDVSGWGYADCGNAQFVLSRQNCCKNFMWNGEIAGKKGGFILTDGRSIGFKNFKCSSI